MLLPLILLTTEPSASKEVHILRLSVFEEVWKFKASSAGVPTVICYSEMVVNFLLAFIEFLFFRLSDPPNEEAVMGNLLLTLEKVFFFSGEFLKKSGEGFIFSSFRNLMN